MNQNVLGKKKWKVSVSVKNKILPLHAEAYCMVKIQQERKSIGNY